jgi:hypothetical protein
MARFLKIQVLPVLAQSLEIKKVLQSSIKPVNDTETVKKGKRSDDQFVWRVVDPNEVPIPRRSKPKPRVVGKEVGVGLDYEHLNKRRQNARVGKITQDFESMKLLKDSWKLEDRSSKK